MYGVYYHSREVVHIVPKINHLWDRVGPSSLAIISIFSLFLSFCQYNFMSRSSKSLRYHQLEPWGTMWKGLGLKYLHSLAISQGNNIINAHRAVSSGARKKEPKPQPYRANEDHT